MRDDLGTESEQQLVCGAPGEDDETSGLEPFRGLCGQLIEKQASPLSENGAKGKGVCGGALAECSTPTIVRPRETW